MKSRSMVPTVIAALVGVGMWVGLPIQAQNQHQHPQEQQQQEEQEQGKQPERSTASGAQAAGGQRAKQLPAQTVRNIGPQLTKNFTFEPFSPPMPDHVWMKANENTITFLHFAKPVNQPNNKLVFIGDGVRGKFCAENQPDQGKTGYVHFHSLVAEPGHAHTEMEKMGHGGKAGAEGFWLRHIAVDAFDMMGTHFTPGLAMNFMPTPPPKCGA